jgi:CDP-glucose 4,6-dehydratase
VTSDKCYENLEISRGYSETDRLGGYDPYSSSKGCAELVTAAYRNSFSNPKDYGGTHKLSLSSARAGNVIGGGDWGADRLVPDCVRALSRKKRIQIRNPNAVRPWQYVLEPVGGYLLLGALMGRKGAKFAGAWNFGPSEGNVLNVEGVVGRVVEEWGSGGYVVSGGRHPHEANILKLNSSKARRLLGWKSTYGIAETVGRTVGWYRSFYSRAGREVLRELSVWEIEDFSRAAKGVL